jgi:hypothetical protein
LKRTEFAVDDHQTHWNGHVATRRLEQNLPQVNSLRQALRRDAHGNNRRGNPAGGRSAEPVDIPPVLVLDVLTAAVQFSTPVPALLSWTFCGAGLKPLPETKLKPPATPPKNGTPPPATVNVTGTIMAVELLVNVI